MDPRYKDIMSCYSPLIDDVVNRYTYVSASIDDLAKKAEAGTLKISDISCPRVARCQVLPHRKRWTGLWNWPMNWADIVSKIKKDVTF